MTAAPNPYPSYLEMHQRLPVGVWHAVRAAVVAGAFGLIALLFADPRAGLIAWWLFILPCVPLLLVIAPGLWRNVCPMAALNQVPRLLGFSRNHTAPSWLLRNAILVQATFYFALISTRAPVFDHNGPAVGTLMLVAFAAAFAGGVIFKGKSGWCGTLCPLMPVQRLYGQTPAVVVPNSHCRTCVGCTPNCLDFNPRLAVIADVHESDADRVAQLKLFAGTFPGFVLAFFTVPTSVIGAPADLGLPTVRYYLLTATYMLVSLGLFSLLNALLPISTFLLMAVFGAAALNLHNWLRFTTSFHVHKPFWLRVAEEAVVLAVTARFVARTFQHERRVTQLHLVDAPATAAVPGAETLTSTEVRFENGPRVVLEQGATLLDACERAGIAVDPGCRMGVCGADPNRIVDGAANLSPPSPGERSTLDRLALAGECRMACSARVRGNVAVSLELAPAEVVAPGTETGYDRSVGAVVVIGNGIAGSTAADHVRRLHPACSIDVIGGEVHNLYNRMGISRLVYGRSAMGGLLLADDDWYERNRVSVWLNTLVTEIDREAHDVVLGTGERLHYDRLIIASGAAARVPPIDGLDRDGVFVMRTADDATQIRAFAQRTHARRAIVIGGGLLGLEAAHALHRFGLRTTVVQRSERLLPGQLDERGAALLAEYFRRLGIAVLCGAEPASVASDNDALTVLLADGRGLDADVVVACAGIAPATDLAYAAGIDVARGILVDEHMRTSDPSIFAAGDVAELGGVVPGLWPIAVAQAEVAAANAVGCERLYVPQPVVTILKGVGLNVTAAGDVDGRLGDDIVVREELDDDLQSWRLVVREGTAVGAVVIGDWPDGQALIDAVAARAQVGHLLPALRDGDLSALAVTPAEPEPVPA